MLINLNKYKLKSQCTIFNISMVHFQNGYDIQKSIWRITLLAIIQIVETTLKGTMAKLRNI